MVVDEELKMMSAVCSDGGRITGPHLKEMSRLTHTEYVLRGRSRLDPRDILRETMFAPTVTGSPMQNACTVITRHERTPARLLLGRRGAVHPARVRRPAAEPPASPRTTSTPRSSSAPPISSTDACGFRSARRSCATPTRTARSARPTARPPACSARSARSRATRPAAASQVDAIDEDAPAAEPKRLADDPAIADAAHVAQRPARVVLAESAGCRGHGPVRRSHPRSWSTPKTASRRCSPTSCATSASPCEIVPWSEVTDEQLDEAGLVVCGPGPR